MATIRLGMKLLVVQLILNAVSCSQNIEASLPPEPPTTQPQQEAEPDAVEDLLDRLERSSADLRDFQAKIRYDIWDAVTEEKQIRSGKLIYQVDPDDGSKRFAILFDTFIFGNRQEKEAKHYIFADGWLVEIDHERKQFIKRQIVAPGETFDPLKLGEGPFPLPIGQPKNEVLARFDVKLLDAPSDPFLAKMLIDRDVEGMVLFPKPNTPEAEKFQRVELFYDRETMLPIGINAVAADAIDPSDPNSRNRKMVLLSDLKRNEGVDEAILSIEEPDKRAWDIDIRPWEGQ
ncbi:MAG: hypothetical protein V3T53_11015 [Phycisphaerales bacterium]